jgi:uncharacterized protein YecT (DUF1311 family)
VPPHAVFSATPMLVSRTLRTIPATIALAVALLASPAGSAKTPLEICYDKVGNQGRQAVRPCLEGMMKEADSEMASALAARKKDARQLSQATGRRKSVRSLERAQKQFVAYRKAQCQYVMDAIDAGTGAGDGQRDCMVRLTRQRVEELRAYP